MLKKTFILFTAVLFVTCCGCGVFSSTSYSSPDVLLANGFKGDSIAVFNFSTDGGGLTSRVGSYAADKLSEALFLNAKIKIIDRTSVHKALSDLSISVEEFDKKQLKDFGAKTSAKYIAVGQIYKNNTSDFWEKGKEKRLSLSFRIISVDNGEVVGAASISAEYENELNKVLEKMIDKIVKEMNNLI